MSKVNNIIVLCDGTWNGASIGTTTNIVKLSRLIRQIHVPQPVDPPNVNNVLPPGGSFQGIGTGESIEEFIVNGAIAQDLDKKIKEAYKFVVTSYKNEEYKYNRVWLFGFSRGAYTVRSVAGMINNCGIVSEGRIGVINNAIGNPPLSTDDAVDLAYSIYRNRDDNHKPQGDVAKQFRKKLSYDNSDASIVFMGLWDTVGANGLPSYGNNELEYLEFYDKIVSSDIKYAYQAVATHENIALFEHCPIIKGQNAKNIVEERWFPGIHMDIGGFVDTSSTVLGRPATTIPILGDALHWALNNPISDTTLNWMIDKINHAQGAAGGGFTLGRNIDVEEVAPHTGYLVKLGREIIKKLSSSGLLKLIIRDRNIPFALNDPAVADVLYSGVPGAPGGTNWRNIADPADYSSRTYTTFYYKCRTLAGIIIPWFGMP